MAVASRPDTSRSKPSRRRRGQGKDQARGADGAPSTHGGLVTDFIESFIRVTKGQDAGQLVRLRPWQRALLDDLYLLRPDGIRRYRRGLLGLPRKNGKSTLGSGIALFGLFDEPGAEVYSCAGDKEQARIVFAEARRAVEADPDLSANLRLYRDAIEYPAMHAVYRVLSAEAYTKEGLNPSLVIFDELHVQPTDELWNVMNQGSGTRLQPLVLAITTAGVKSDQTGGDSICYTLYQKGKRIEAGEVDEPTFFFRWWEAPDDAPYDDPATWAAANPAYGDYLYPEDFESVIRTVPEADFRTKRLNQWVNTQRSWLPTGAWDGCIDKGRLVASDEPVVLGFDGSWTGDSTALVGCTIRDPHLFVVGAWERPIDDPHWRVDSDEVDLALRRAVNELNVVEIACDPHEWRQQIATWEDDGLPVTEWITSTATRMVPACKEFYTATLEHKLTHDGDPRLARHLSNATIREDRYGVRITKERANSPRKIDLAVAAIVAYDRARFHEPEARPAVPRFYI